MLGWYNGEQIFVGQRSELELSLMTQAEMEAIANAPTMQFVPTPESNRAKSEGLKRYWEKKRNEMQNQERC